MAPFFCSVRIEILIYWSRQSIILPIMRYILKIGNVYEDGWFINCACRNFKREDGENLWKRISKL